MKIVTFTAVAAFAALALLTSCGQSTAEKLRNAAAHLDPSLVAHDGAERECVIGTPLDFKVIDSGDGCSVTGIFALEGQRLHLQRVTIVSGSFMGLGNPTLATASSMLSPGETARFERFHVRYVGIGPSGNPVVAVNDLKLKP
ncbi:MAG TPA: hypothetical protein VJJ47_00545 [Candidatus Paceibacterota bacterium]